MEFKKSASLTLGLELELQLINPDTGSLVARAADLITTIDQPHTVKPEISTDMIEINSSIHGDASALMHDIMQVAEDVFRVAHSHHLGVCGGGTHPFAHWYERGISDTHWCHFLADKYQYLAKKNAVFGMHVHVGVSDGNAAISLTRAMMPYVPLLIAMSASSPFLDGQDTGFDSCRLHGFRCAALTGAMPTEISDWDAYKSYVERAVALGLVENPREFYWDVRPKPEFGTVEIRVFDTPLTLRRACQLAAFTQTLVAYLQTIRTADDSQWMYYEYNVFQACRYGLKGAYIDSMGRKGSLSEALKSLLGYMDPYAQSLGNSELINELWLAVLNTGNDSTRLRGMHRSGRSMSSLVKESCELFLS